MIHQMADSASKVSAFPSPENKGLYLTLHPLIRMSTIAKATSNLQQIAANETFSMQHFAPSLQGWPVDELFGSRRLCPRFIEEIILGREKTPPPCLRVIYIH